MIAADVRWVADPASGRATLVTGDGSVWLLNAPAATALAALVEGGSATAAEDALLRRWPHIPRERLRADLAHCLAPLRQAGVVR
ncbi:hypothetical protein [Streptomyces sp. NPDC049879]|uniref:hypothetical protein n=1 Tax=Streptomyces sp. NPDC049879 TaxID=3365598 RepID=UPI0037A63EB8